MAMELQTIKNMIEDNYTNSVIPLHNVTNDILELVIEDCKKHVEAAESGSEPSCSLASKLIDNPLKAWDVKFIKVHQETLFNLILAANYLDIKGLLDLTCQAVADMMEGNTIDQIHKIFHIENDFTQE